MAQMQIPTTKEQFEAVMQEIDAKLIASGVPIPGRELRALGEYARRFGLEIPWPAPDYVPQPGIYAGQDAAAHLRSWFDGRYGKRQAVHHGPGTTVLLIRGDPWEMRLPLVYGTIRCVVDADLERYRSEPKIGMQKPPTLNILTLLVDFPQGLAKQLTRSELESIYQIFVQALDCFRAIDSIRSRPFTAEVDSDLRASIHHLTAARPHHGQSKWASSQAAEKLMKSYLEVKTGTFPYIHKISELAQLVSNAGGSSLAEPQVLAALETEAAVRYGKSEVTLRQAVNAHHAALLVGRSIANWFAALPP